LAIEDEIDGQAIRLSFEAHGSGGSISAVHDAPHSRREGRVCRATSENACFMTLARLSLSRGRGRARRLDPTFSIRAFDRQPRKSSLAILPMWASAPKAPVGAERAVGFAMRWEAWRPF